MTTILADKPTAKKPGALAYEIPNPPPTVHDLLLQKSDGTYALVVWSERVQGSNDVLIRFQKPFQRASLYDPTVGALVIAELQSATTIRLSLTDHSQIVKIDLDP